MGTRQTLAVRRLVIIVVLVLLNASCDQKKKEAAPKGRPPAPVMVAAAATRTVPVQLEAIGNVEPITAVSVKSMVSGEVLTVHFREGEDVSKGQLLFTIDPRQAQAALRQAESTLVRTRAQLAKARTDADRYERLVKDGIVTQDQFETYRTLADSLAADLAAQEALIQNLKVQLSYCTIRSPLSGRTGNLMIHAGNVVKANDTVSLVTINQITPINVSFTIPEKELPRIKQQLSAGRLIAEAVPSGDTGTPETGRVSFLDNAVDAATGTIRLKATFANAHRRLWPGQFATVRLTLATLANAVIVPSQAVQTGQQGEYLFVVTPSNSAELRPVRTGVTYGSVTVIERGVQPGEQVVIDGQMRLSPGAPVTVRKPTAGQGQPSQTTPHHRKQAD